MVCCEKFGNDEKNLATKKKSNILQKFEVIETFGYIFIRSRKFG